jgi:hypothetical protein
MKLLGVTRPYRAPAPTPVPGPDPTPVPPGPVTPDSPEIPKEPLPSYEDPPPVNPVASQTGRPSLREGTECGSGRITRPRNVA